MLLERGQRGPYPTVDLCVVVFCVSIFVFLLCCASCLYLCLVDVLCAAGGSVCGCYVVCHVCVSVC